MDFPNPLTFEAFDVTYSSEEQKSEYVWATSWGVGSSKIMTVMIVMTHMRLVFHGMGTLVKIRSLLDSLGPSSW